MHSDTPSIWLAIAPVIMTSVLGCLLGVISAYDAPEGSKSRIIVLSIVIFFFVGIGWSWQLLKKIFYPDRFRSYGNESKGIQKDTGTPSGTQEMAVPIILSEGETRWLECELTQDEWRAMCEAVHAAKNFSLDVLRTRFTDTNARNVYAKVTGPLSMEDVAILIKDGKGYAVTQGRGEYFFERMATLPFPYPIKPDVLKMVDPNRHTHNTHTYPINTGHTESE